MKREIKHAFCAIFIFQTRSRGQVWQSSQKGNNDDALFIMQKTEMMYKIFLHGNTVNTKIY